jgi:hypothetical protein
MKLTKTLIGVLTILLSIFSITLFAQGFYMPATTKINTPYGPHNITTYQYVRTPWVYSGGGPVSSKYEFTVTLKNDSSFIVRSKIHFKDDVDYLRIKKGGQVTKITASDTKQISRKRSDNGKQLVGIATDSCWLFQVETGAINCYSFLAEADAIAFTTAIQYGDDGEIVSLTKGNLLKITGVYDKDIMKQVKKENLPEAVRIFNKKIKKVDAEREKEEKVGR